jgi:hypothetical protein
MPGDVKTEPPHELQRVMIMCPESGEPVPTGVRIDPASVETTDRSERSFVCPHCFHVHTWTMDDAWIEAGAC